MSRLATRPKGMDSVRQRIWSKYEEDPARYSLTAMGNAIGKNHSYMQQYFNRHRPTHLFEEERHLLARFLGISERELRPATQGMRLVQEDPVIPDDGNEGEAVPLDHVPQGLRPLVKPKTEMWRVLVNNIALSGVQTGDYVLLDLNSRRAGSYVCATVRKNDHERSIFRLYLPPYLFIVRDRTLEQAEEADDVTTIVRGSIVGRYGVFE